MRSVENGFPVKVSIEGALFGCRSVRGIGHPLMPDRFNEELFWWIGSLGDISQARPRGTRGSSAGGFVGAKTSEDDLVSHMGAASI